MNAPLRVPTDTRTLLIFPPGSDFTSGILSLTALALLQLNPAQGFPPVGERLHLDHPAITDCVDIRKAYILPMVATPWGEPGREQIRRSGCPQ
jgi:hypothetical protein